MPQRRVRDVFEEFNVEDSLLKEELYDFFESPNNQEELKYDIYANLLTPLEKEYSWSCKMQLFATSSNFYWLILAFILLVLLISYGVKIFMFRKKVKMVYEYLKMKTLKNESILIEDHRPAIIKMVKSWTEELWD